MFQIIDSPKGFEIQFNNKCIIKHSFENPAFYMGIKDVNLVMKKGAFEFTNNTKYSPLKDFKIFQNGIEFYNDQYKLKIHLKEKSELLHIEFQNEENNSLKIHLAADESEKIFGLGEHFTKLNLRGEIVKNWIEEHITHKQMYSKIMRKITSRKPKKWKFEEYKTYYISSLFVSSNRYFCHVDTSSFGLFNFKNDEYHELEFSATPRKIVIGQRERYLDLLALLTDYVGRMPKLPDWIYDGMILSIQGGTTKIQDKLNKMLKAGAKINGIWAQDWCGELYTYFGKQVFWNWKHDKKLYPQLDEYIKKWEKKKVRFLGYINPYLNANGDLYKVAKEKDYLVKNHSDEIYLTKATSFEFGIVDLTNPKAYEWYKEIIKNNLIGLGMKGWMADFGEYLPSDSKLNKGNGEEFHNQWPDLWVKLNREAVEETDQLGEVIFFNRAGYTKTVKHTTLIWNGDQHVDFTDDFGLGSVVRAQLCLSMSGIGFCHSDTGGYTTVPTIKRSKELYLRWLEMNAFSPVLRSHEGNKPWVNKQFDSDGELISATVKFSNVYAMLKPYLKHIEKEYVEKGYPIIRPVFLHYEEDTYYELDKEYLLGQDIYVCPVLTSKTKKRKVILPDDTWIHLFENKEYSGGTYEIDAPIGKPAVFYRKDSQYKELFEGITKYVNDFTM